MGSEHTVQIKVTNGSAVSYKIAESSDFTNIPSSSNFRDGYVLVPNLDAGDYNIEEASTDGMYVSVISGGNNNADTETRKVTVHVTAGDTNAIQTSASAAYTNNLSLVDIKVIKVDEETRNRQDEKTLSGAEFELYRYMKNSEGGPNAEEDFFAYPPNDNLETTGDDGLLTFKGLPDGRYKIKEKKAPNGYVMADNVEIEFTINQGVVRWDNEGAILISHTPASSDTFVVGNTPGAALPNTGGTGTTLFYLIGAVMTLGAGLLLVQKRKMAA